MKKDQNKAFLIGITRGESHCSKNGKPTLKKLAIVFFVLAILMSLAPMQQSTVTAATTDIIKSNGDGLGFSAPVQSNPLTLDSIKFSGYGPNAPNGITQWPTGFTKDGNNYSGAVYDGQGGVWFAPAQVPASSAGNPTLLRMDIDTGAISCYKNWPVGVTFPTTTTSATYLFSSIVYGNGFIWLIPDGANAVVRVNPSTGEMQAFNNWPAGFTCAINGYNFRGGVYYNGQLWLVPFNAKLSGKPLVVCLDPTTGVMTGYNSFPTGAGTFQGGVLDDFGYMWLMPETGNQLVRVNLSATNGTIGAMNGYTVNNTTVPGLLNLGNANQALNATNYFVGGVNSGDGSIWLIPNDANFILKVNADSSKGAVGTITKINWSSTASSYNTFLKGKFCGAAFDGRYIWMIPYTANDIVRVDTGGTTGTTTNPDMRLYSFSDLRTQWLPGFTGSGLSFMGAAFDGKNIWLAPYQSDRIVRIEQLCDGDITLARSVSTKQYTGTTKITTKADNNQRSGGNPIGRITKLEWFRVSISDTTDYAARNVSEFNFAYSGATSANKGEQTGPNAVSPSTYTPVASYSYNDITADRNARYWVKVTFQTDSGVEFNVIKSLKVSNNFTPVDVYVQDKTMPDNTVMKAYTRINATALPRTSAPGIPYDLNGTTVIPQEHMSTVNATNVTTVTTVNYDTVTYTRNSSAPSTLWQMIVPGAPFASTPTNAESSVITLDANVNISEDGTANSNTTRKNYTVNYVQRADVYGITYNANYPAGTETESGSVPTDSSIYYNGNMVTLKANTGSLAKIGWTFLGWSTNSGATTPTYAVNGAVVTPPTFNIGASSVNLYGVWTKATYAITYSGLQGATNPAANPATYTYGTGVASFASPTVNLPTGQKFDGWFDAATGGTKVASIGTTTAGNITLYAQYSNDSYEITYNTASLQGAINPGSNPTSYTYGTGITVFYAPTVNLPTGHSFSGWYDAATGGNKITSIGTSAAGAVELYARWTPNTYLITFDYENGTALYSDQTVTYGAAIGTLPAPIRTGYTFGGWFSGIDPTSMTGGFAVIPCASGIGAEYTSATIYMTASDMTLHALWLVNNYTITLHYEDGATTNGTHPVTFGEEVGALPIPSRAGFAFSGWFTGQNGTGTEYTATTVYDLDSDSDFFAKWTAYNPPEIFIKLPNKVQVKNGDVIDYTFSGISNPYASKVQQFRITDNPPVGLAFIKGSIPAFNKGTGLTYDVIYTTNMQGETVLHDNVDATLPFTFNAPTLRSGEYITGIILEFVEVPVGFGVGNKITYTFKVTATAAGTKLLNKGFLSFVFNGTTVIIPNKGNSTVTIYDGSTPYTGDDRGINGFIMLALSALMGLAVLKRKKLEKARN